jgi:phosphomannomutase
MKHSLKIGVSGVRGVVGQSFTPQVATSFAQALGTFVGGGVIMVGRDTRPTGAMIEQAVLAGLLSVGCKPVLLGTVPTPSLLYSVYRERARGGIMITASHNGSEWNALKFVDRRGLFLSPVHAEELFDIYHQKDFPLASEADLRRPQSRAQAVTPHFERVAGYVDQAAIRAARLRVVVDCCNGVGALHTRPFLEEYFHCSVVTLFDTPSGCFEREPEPLPENLAALGHCVRETGAAVGFAQDPDGDRLAVVDESGQPVGEEITVALAVHAVLTHHGKGPIAANLSAGMSIQRVAEKTGCELIRTRTGEVYVTEAMLRANAVAGGEHTGGIIIPAIHPCRDSYAGMAVILERLALTGATIRQLCNEIPRFALLKDKVPIRPEDAAHALRNLRRAYADSPMQFMDGLFIDFGDRWLHVRRSNTEPVLRLIAESATPAESARLIADARQALGLTTA